MIAYCGINCSDCQIRLATKADSEESRIEVAKAWSQKFGWNLKPADINCEGCLSEGGRLFNYCETCGVRQCAGQKAVETCADCAEYGCRLSGNWRLRPNRIWKKFEKSFN
jgi:hypothetical protein